MNTTIINMILKSLDIFDIAETLLNIMEEEELITLWNKYNDDFKICTIDILNTELSRPFTEVLKELHSNFNVKDKYCYYNGNVWVTFTDIFNTPYSPFSLHSLAGSLKHDFIQYLEERGVIQND